MKIGKAAFPVLSMNNININITISAMKQMIHFRLA